MARVEQNPDLRSRWAPTVVYSLRVSLVLLIAVSVLWHRVAAWLASTPSEHEIMTRLLQNDLYHSLFFAIGSVFALGCLLPGSFRRRRIAALLAGVLSGGLIATTPDWTRLDVTRPTSFQFACFFVGANIALMILLAGREKEETGWLRFFALPVLGDALFPLAVWARYRGRAYGMKLWRPVVVALVLAPTLLVWLAEPLPIGEPIAGHGWWRQIAPSHGAWFYQAVFEEDRGTVLVVDEQLRRVERYAPQADTTFPQQRLILPPKSNRASALGVDRQRDLLVQVDFADQVTRVIEADELRLVREIPITNSPTVYYDDHCRTFWFPEPESLVVSCPGGLFAMCPDGARVTASLRKNQNFDLTYDPKRNELWATGSIRQLLALRPRPFSLSRSRNKPFKSDRSVFDPLRDRLVFSAPFPGALYSVTLEDLSIDEFRTFPGVHELEIDPQRRWLLVAGLFSSLEIRDADTMALITRGYGPPWPRWWAVDSAGGKAYLTTKYHGLWELDLDAVAEDRIGNWLRRWDPYYLLGQLVAKPLFATLGIRAQQGDIPLDQPVEPAPGPPCGAARWYDLPAEQAGN
ncbi:MAG: hypothetical protein P9L99_19585 [Candidatus Lernaella stagnicola]|nr:hypothetical protein [Candidatus Lernaella stagnicola]